MNQCVKPLNQNKMTAKEKAKELVDKFRNEFNWVEKDHNVDLYRDAKQCALIAVELALEFCRSKDMNEEFDMIIYLLEVKDEIEKL